MLAAHRSYLLPSLGPIFRDRFQMLLAKACPFDQMPLVDLEDAIEAGIEDRGQGRHTLRKRRFFADKGQADPDDDLGRTKIDATEWDINLRIVEERTVEDRAHDG